MHNTLELPGSLFEVITFWTGECFGFSFSILCSVLPLRVKDLPLTLPLDGFLLVACGGSEGGWLRGRYAVLSVLLPRTALNLSSRDDPGY